MQTSYIYNWLTYANRLHIQLARICNPVAYTTGSHMQNRLDMQLAHTCKTVAYATGSTPPKSIPMNYIIVSQMLSHQKKEQKKVSKYSMACAKHAKNFRKEKVKLSERMAYELYSPIDP